MAQPRPNIIIVTTDQQRTDTLSCYGSDFTSTPNVDRLAAEGVRLDRAYCTNPVCTPSRVSIFSGQQVGRHGAWNVGTRCPEDTVMLSHLLGGAGYRTHYVGKMHFQPFQGRPAESRERVGDDAGSCGWNGPYYGFETVEIAAGHGNWSFSGHYRDWLRERGVSDEQVARWKRATRVGERHFFGNGYDWELPTCHHHSVWTADRAVAFLKAHDPSRPFVLGVGFPDPHHPHVVPTDFEDRVDPAGVPMPIGREGELDDKPPHFLEAREGRLESSPMRGEFPFAGQGSGADFRVASEQDVRTGRAYYHTMVRLIDREFGRMLAALDETGLAANTLLVFTSDHGELLGDHGLWGKGVFHYEPLLRVPAIVRWPRAIPAGGRTDAIVSLADLVPTALAAAGVDIPADVDGVNQLPVLRGESDRARDSALIEMVDNPETLRLKTIVTADRKLTWYAGQPYGELYDLANDPDEIVNLWDDPGRAGEKAELLGRLLDYVERYENRAPRTVYA